MTQRLKDFLNSGWFQRFLSALYKSANYDYPDGSKCSYRFSGFCWFEVNPNVKCFYHSQSDVSLLILLTIDPVIIVRIFCDRPNTFHFEKLPFSYFWSYKLHLKHRSFFYDPKISPDCRCRSCEWKNDAKLNLTIKWYAASITVEVPSIVFSCSITSYLTK